MPTERDNIKAIQQALDTIKKAAQVEIKRAKDGDDAKLINAWSKVYHSTGVHHGYLTDLLFQNFPEFAGEIVTKGPGGR